MHSNYLQEISMIIDSVEQLAYNVLGKFTTKVSSMEYRVSNQIQVSINIVGIRYRTRR